LDLHTDPDGVKKREGADPEYLWEEREKTEREKKKMNLRE